MKTEVVIDEIRVMINAYLKGYNNLGISKLLDFRDKLSVYSFTLAEETANAKDTYNVNLYINKIEFNRSKQHYMNEKVSGVKADAMANVDNEASLRMKLDAESLGYRCELLLRQINKILDSAGQRISYLRKEEERARNLT